MTDVRVKDGKIVLPGRIDARWAFQRYEAVRARLPQAAFPQTAARAADLSTIQDRFDGFIFDSFGVLNVGETPIATAPARIAALREAGKHLLVLTNAATAPLSTLPEKYARLGFDFAAHEIVSSREVLAMGLRSLDPDILWGVVAPTGSDLAEFDARTVRISQESSLEALGGVILLSSKDISAALAERLGAFLAARPLPLLVGNPDLVAPRETGFSLEPGAYAHGLADTFGLAPEFFGKPFGNAFQTALSRLPAGLDPTRIAMVGDTLHTDILGGAAAGLGTILVTDDGVMQDMDVEACIAASGIVPDYIVPVI